MEIGRDLVRTLIVFGKLRPPLHRVWTSPDVHSTESHPAAEEDKERSEMTPGERKVFDEILRNREVTPVAGMHDFITNG